jgi:adenylate cyclase
MSEKLDPEALVKMLHDFLNPMSNIIINQGGTIDKYMGDAIMAEFGAPLEQPEHARLACRAALEMVAALKDLNRQWEAQGRPPLHVGVGRPRWATWVPTGCLTTPPSATMSTWALAWRG